MEIAYSHHVTYLRKDDARLKDIAASISATSDVVQLLPRVLEQLFPGLSVVAVTIALDTARQQSPLEEFFNGGIIGRFQYTVEQVVGGIGRLGGIEVLEREKSFVSSVIVLLLLSGAIYVGYRMLTKEAPASIAGDYNTVINIVANGSGQSVEDVERIVENALKDRDRRLLARSASDFAAPARDGGGVEVGGVGVLAPDSIAAIPDRSDLDNAEPEEIDEFRERATINVRARDLDNNRRGWAGYITIGNDQHRVRMIIVRDIDLQRLERLSSNGPIEADVQIFFRRDKNGGWRPYVMHVTKLYDEIGVAGEPARSS